MLTVTVIAVGKIKEKYLTDACAEYQKRLGAFCKCSVVEVSEHRLPDNPSPAQIEAGIVAEGHSISAKIPKDSYIIAMCVEGDKLSSEGLAKQLMSIAVDGKSQIAVLIGGSFGLWRELKNKANLKLSMSDMTFPHQLARVMLLEQIYRAEMINNGGKYHK